MSILNSENYNGLAGYSQSAPKEAGPFLSVFITGEPRDGQDVGKMQVMANFDNKLYVENNKDELCFVIMFIKKYWEKTEYKGDRDHTVAFGWNDEPKIDDQCRYKYLVAGLLLDPDNKYAKKMRPDDPTKETVIYFKCQGTKFAAAMNLITAFDKKCDELTPLSDNVDFEKSVVTPRRFITKAKVTTTDSAHGKKYTYDFEPFKKLADEVVVKFMDKSVEYVPEFDKQFDKTSSVSGGNSSAPAGIAGVNPSFEGEEAEANDTPAGEDADFNLDI